MVRNLLMSSVANESLKDQEKLYKKLWLHPIEEKCQGPTDLSAKLGSFQRDQAKKVKTRYVSDLEKKSKEVSKSMPKEKSQSIVTYTEFYSFYEDRISKKMMLPPNQVDDLKEVPTRTFDDLKVHRTGKVKVEKVDKMGKVDVSKADQESVYSASMEIMDEISAWISNQK